MPKALYFPLQLAVGTFACLYATPLLAQVTSDGTVNAKGGHRQAPPLNGGEPVTTQINQNGNVA